MSGEPHCEWAGQDCEDVANDIRHAKGRLGELSGRGLLSCYLILIWAIICIIYQTAQSLAWLWQLVKGGAV